MAPDATDRRSVIEGIGTTVIGGFGLVGLTNAKGQHPKSPASRDEIGTRGEGCETMSQELAASIEEQDPRVEVGGSTVFVEPYRGEESADAPRITIEDIGCMAPSQSNL